MRYTFAVASALIAAPLAAQSVRFADIPITCNTTRDKCPSAQPIMNPDGSNVEAGSTNIATAQTTVGTTATLVAAARVNRLSVTFSVGAANTCAFGPAGVTLSTGFPLQPTAGANLTVRTAAAVYAVCSASTVISDIEGF